MNTEDTEAITTLLRERVATLARALREAGPTTIGEWCGMPHRQEVRTIGENRTAFVTYPLDVLMLRSHALNTPGTEIVQEWRPNHLTHDAEGNEEPVSYASGEPPSPGLGNVFSADGAPKDWTVFARMPVSDGARLVNTITCAELAAMVERDAERLVSSTADEIDRAARFYVEPHLLGAALSSERLRSLVWSWPFSEHIGDGPNVCESSAISHAALWFSAKPHDAEGLGLNREVGEPDGGSWMQDVQRWHVQSPRVTSTTERGETMRALPGMVGTWPLDGAAPTLDLARPPEENLAAFSRYVRGCSHIGIGLLYVARREALAELEASHEAAAKFALELVLGLGSDSAWYRSIRRRVAIDVLSTEEGADKSDGKAIEELAEALRVTMGDLAAALPLPEVDALEDGIPRWDARAATFAENRLGEHGKAWAKAAREAGADRTRDGRLWRLWADPNTSGIARGFARVLWRERVGPQLARERKNPPALTYQVHEDVARIHSRAHVLEKANGQRRMRFDDSDPIVLAPSMADQAVIKLVERGANLLGSVNGHRALRWEVVEGYERVMRGEADARVLRVDSGWAPLAERLGMKSKKAADDLRAIVYAQAAVRFTLPTGDTGNLIAIREQPARGRRRGMIEITLGTMLLPHYGEELAERLHGRDRSEARRLVPLIATLPPMVGREREHGAQATLSMLVVQELRKHARTLASEGSVPISAERLAELAGKAGLPAGIVPRVIDRWTQDGPDGAAFLESPSRHRYTLGKAHARELAFLIASGRLELGGAAAGRRSVEARNAKRRRLTRGLTKGKAIE